MNRQAECAITEEAVIDALLQPEDAEQRVRLLRHAAECGICRGRIREWAGVLGPSRGCGELAPPRHSASWRRLRRAVWLSAQARRLAAGCSALMAKRRGLTAFGVAALLACGGYFGALTDVADRLRSQPPELMTARNDEELIRSFAMMGGRAQQVPVYSVGLGKAKGIALVGADDSELLLLLEGLQDDPEAAYRVWSVHAQSAVDLGTMRRSPGRAHLHYQGGEMNVAQTISVRREPKGGVPFADAPEVAHVQLRPR
ncbi:anti-sigma factor domain-containing protein [Paenibacillus hamazuiensis]|uniref:anti-sigma factor domain-containing protein n=1 Tax=Paenibacillus hamazuiensis TaxID=2936508 RepID=UPI00200EAC02|nr:anti-sigma factor [Paenibacillus hamazuiensis]